MSKSQLEVKPIKTSDTLFTLEIFAGPVRIGEYERSIKNQIERKIGEIDRVADLLRWVHDEYGPFEVRWNGALRRKEVRSNGRTVCIVPQSCWGDPYQAP